MFTIEKNIDRLERGLSTYFLDAKEQNILKGKLKKILMKSIFPTKIVKKIFFILLKNLK